MENIEKESIKETKKVKINYDILKKEGYKLSYGEKNQDYIDIFLVKKVDDSSNMTIHISEKRVTKRFEGSNYNNNTESLTLKEVQGIAKIISQIC